MLLNTDQVRRLYRRTARLYDAAVWVYGLTGANRHRRQAVAALRSWESVRRHLREVQYREFYAGAASLCVGERSITRHGGGGG